MCFDPIQLFAVCMFFEDNRQFYLERMGHPGILGMPALLELFPNFVEALSTFVEAV
jgi:hypothetical protein